ncbi:MAG: SPOR domain-containing protein [Treponema sp.]|nr:SPOR domain-containing protein [Treponema sp.]
MEKKKLLLVAVSVGVFLVIVVGAAILVFSAKEPAGITENRYLPESSGESYSRSATTDASSLLGAEELRGLQDPQAVSPIQENIITFGNENPAVGTEDKTIISVARPQAAAVPDAVAEQPAIKPQPQSPQQAVPVQRTPVSVKSAAAPPQKTYNDFWVQAGSFSTRDRADGVKKTLHDKGIAAIITNQQINDQTFYRVRIGPYTSRNEADYWLAMIKSIDGFESSQVWESQSKR